MTNSKATTTIIDGRPAELTAADQRPSPKPRQNGKADMDLAESEATEREEAAAAESATPGTPPRWHARRRVRIAIALLVLAVALAAADVVLTSRVNEASATAQARAAATTTAQRAVPDVLSYNYTSIADYPRTAENRTTGDFNKALTKLIDTAVLPAAKTNQIVTKTRVPASSVVQASPDSVVLLMFIDQETTTTKQPTPQLEGSRVRVTMQRVSGNWLISELTPV